MSNLTLLFIAMVTSSASLIMRKSLVNKMPPPQFEVMAGILHAVFSMCAYFAMGTKYQKVDGGVYVSALVQSLLSFFTVFSFTYAIRTGNSLGASSAVLSASPLITLVLSLLFFGEKLEARTLLGMLCIVVGTSIIATR
jgi:drug/metabolite transporter (DMT)-like permease